MSCIKFITTLLVLLVFSSKVVIAQNNKSLSGKDFTKDFTIKDTMFKAPYVDINEWRDKPVRHHYIHAGFTETDTSFSYYFPAKEKYEGHFFQYITPVPDNETYHKVQ